MDFYKNKLAFITGGSEGIGLAVAKDFIKAGSQVVILSRSQSKLDEAKKLLDGKVHAVSLDITDFDAVKKTFTNLFNQFGVPDFLINCAGFAYPGYIEKVDVEEYRKMMDVNYFGIVNTTKVFVEELLNKKKKAYIVNTSSLAGFMGLFGYTGYCASKYAVIGFSKALRAELKQNGIHVSVLCPPNTRTPGLDRENKVKPSEVLKMEEKAKVVDPEEVSKALIKALPSGKFMIIPTMDGNLAHYLSRFAPAILDQFTKRPH